VAGGIDWFRWHHGSVTDPKFQLVARKAGVGLPDVIAVWAFVLEKASASEERGSFGDLDHEAIDCLFGMDDGKTLAILEQMEVRGLVADGCICAWEKRQPKREREDDTAAERKRRQRERDANQSHDTPSAADQSHVTPCHATSHQKTPRGEERREEKEDMAKTGCADLSPSSPADANGVQTSPLVDECPQQAIVSLFHECVPTARRVRDWTPSRAALLRGRWREDRKRQNLDWWRRFFSYVNQSPFLTGKSITPGRRPFELGLEWLLKPENFAKVREGAYHEQEQEVAA